MRLSRWQQTTSCQIVGVKKVKWGSFVEKVSFFYAMGLKILMHA